MSITSSKPSASKEEIYSLICERGKTMHTGSHTQMSQAMQNCIQECTTCHTVCLQTITHCLQMGGEHAEPAHIRLLMDCAEICQTSANFMLRNSDLHGKTCGVCAEVCERCAQDCERFTNDPVMQQCAEVCRSCAASCREMAAMA
jgi:hypothetical protein